MNIAVRQAYRADVEPEGLELFGVALPGLGGIVGHENEPLALQASAQTSQSRLSQQGKQ